MFKRTSLLFQLSVREKKSFTTLAPVEMMMGATLEIQRAQQMEALEQQMIQQQINQVWSSPKISNFPNGTARS